jgi:hypothetical protein
MALHPENYWERDCDTGDERDDNAPLCDSGRSPHCTGGNSEVIPVPYLRDPLRVCKRCYPVEIERLERGPADGELESSDGIEGGVGYRSA